MRATCQRVNAGTRLSPRMSGWRGKSCVAGTDSKCRRIWERGKSFMQTMVQSAREHRADHQGADSRCSHATVERTVGGSGEDRVSRQNPAADFRAVR